MLKVTDTRTGAVRFWDDLSLEDFEEMKFLFEGLEAEEADASDAEE